MKFDRPLSDAAITKELGRRLAADRVARGLTQAGFAAEAGVSKRTIERIESGQASQLSNFIRYLRVLDRVAGLDVVVPEPQPNPVDLLRALRKAPKRVRKSTAVAPRSEPWRWGDER